MTSLIDDPFKMMPLMDDPILSFDSYLVSDDFFHYKVDQG